MYLKYYLFIFPLYHNKDRKARVAKVLITKGMMEELPALLMKVTVHIDVPKTSCSTRVYVNCVYKAHQIWNCKL